MQLKVYQCKVQLIVQLQQYSRCFTNNCKEQLKFTTNKVGRQYQPDVKICRDHKTQVLRMISPSLSGICVIASRRPFPLNLRAIEPRARDVCTGLRLIVVASLPSCHIRRGNRVKRAARCSTASRCQIATTELSTKTLYSIFPDQKNGNRKVTQSVQSSQSCEIGRCEESVLICALPAMIARLYPTCVSLPV